MLQKVLSFRLGSLNKLAMAELRQKVASDHPQQRYHLLSMRFAAFQSRWKQASQEPTPFFTYHQDLPENEEKKLRAILHYTESLTDEQFRYFQHLLIYRIKYTYRLGQCNEYAGDIKKTILKEMALVKDQKMEEEVSSLMLHKREEIAKALK